MKNNIKEKVKSFLHEYKLNTVTLDELRSIIKSQGFTIIEFNHIYNSEHVAALIEALNLREMIAKSRGFTYADSQRRLVFLHEDLSEEEKLLVLAHEEGHIYCDHFSTVPIIGKDVVEEHEANEFTHYLLNRGPASKVGSFLGKRKKLLCAIALVLAVSAIGAILFYTLKKEHSYYGEYYLTSTGNKYHEGECIFVKNKTNAHRMTVQQFESGNYEPCGICLPPDEQ